LQSFLGRFNAQVLGKNHVIQNLEKCDFRPIYTWYMADREEKKKMTKPVRLLSSFRLIAFLQLLSWLGVCEERWRYASSANGVHPVQR